MKVVLPLLSLLLFLLFAFRTAIKRACRKAMEGDNDSAAANAQLAEIIAFEKQRMKDQAKDEKAAQAGAEPEGPVS